MNPLDKLTPGAQAVLNGAYGILREAKHNQLDVEHLLMSLLTRAQAADAPELAAMFERLGVEVKLVQSAAAQRLDHLLPPGGGASFLSTRLLAIFSTAASEAERLRTKEVGPEHLLLAMTVKTDDPVARLLKDFGLDKKSVENALPGQAQAATPVEAQPAPEQAQPVPAASAPTPATPAQPQSAAMPSQAAATATTPATPAQPQVAANAPTPRPPLTTPPPAAPPSAPTEEPELTHFNEAGRARMVDVSDKAVTERQATARGEITMEAATLTLIREGRAKKGDVLAVAQVAGIMAAKKTSELIPMCHPLMLTGIDLRFEFDDKRPAVLIEAEVKTSGQTGVEMEALTAVSAAALTIYDMVKASDKTMQIGAIRLTHKSGGKSGTFEAKE